MADEKAPATRVATELTPELRERLDQFAARKGISRSDVLKLALTEYLDFHETHPRRDHLA